MDHKLKEETGWQKCFCVNDDEAMRYYQAATRAVVL